MNRTIFDCLYEHWAGAHALGSAVITIPAVVLLVNLLPGWTIGSVTSPRVTPNSSEDERKKASDRRLGIGLVAGIFLVLGIVANIRFIDPPIKKARYEVTVMFPNGAASLSDKIKIRLATSKHAAPDSPDHALRTRKLAAFHTGSKWYALELGEGVDGTIVGTVTFESRTLRPDYSQVMKKVGGADGGEGFDVYALQVDVLSDGGIFGHKPLVSESKKSANGAVNVVLGYKPGTAQIK